MSSPLKAEEAVEFPPGPWSSSHPKHVIRKEELRFESDGLLGGRQRKQEERERGRGERQAVPAEGRQSELNL